LIAGAGFSYDEEDPRLSRLGSSPLEVDGFADSSSDNSDSEDVSIPFIFSPTNPPEEERSSRKPSYLPSPTSPVMIGSVQS